ncbi:hypothetical protein [Thiomonas sp.]|uniref:hypothetical protein n=1 Tax=Thiomonas sp. TaxID=2047785 RepID=UPI00262BD6BF|nr:hypothetical protein [Thiomonas sp.]
MATSALIFDPHVCAALNHLTPQNTHLIADPPIHTHMFTNGQWERGLQDEEFIVHVHQSCRDGQLQTRANRSTRIG